MKTVMFILFVISLFTIDSVTQLEKSKLEQDEKWETERENEFVQEMFSGGRMEMLLGNLAKNKAEGDEVRQFAEMMVQDHSKANADLSSAIQETGGSFGKGLLEKHQKKIDELSGGTDDFDKQYMNMMVKDHEEDIKKLEEASKKVKDERLRMWVTSNLPTLQMHLEEAKRVRDLLK
jgi:putative membrane protein